MWVPVCGPSLVVRVVAASCSPPFLVCWYYSAVLFCSYHVTALYCAWCEVPRGAFLFSAKPKSSSYFGRLFILNVLLDVNDGPGQAALHHQRN